jgi:serine/threonine protein phosphatase 1
MKIFAISDMHSYLTPTLKALKEAGWDENDSEHIIIVCGDALDRGNETAEMVEWLIDLINKGKLIYITGNHDLLMQEMLNRGYSMSHDRHNGTEKSYYQLLNAHADKMDGRRPDEIVRTALQPLYDNMVNYFETKNHIFVHSWIPTDVHYEGKMKPWYQEGKTLTWMEDWRNANDVEWEEAMWGNPFKRWQEGLNKTGKTIVFGHWHCSTGHSIASNRQISEFEDDAIWEPFIHDNIIGIDRCTAHTGEVNVLVLEDDLLE